MATTFPYGYSGTPQGMGQMLTEAQLMLRSTVNRLDPEFRRRVFAMMEAAAKVGIPLGVGTGWRIQPNPPPPGFAKPGNSNHESFPAGSNTATAVAADMVPNVSWDWMEANCSRFGLKTFRNVNSEPWHIQPAEIPNSRNWKTTPWKLSKFPLPGTTPPAPPTPPPDGGNDDMWFIARYVDDRYWYYVKQDLSVKKPVRAIGDLTAQQVAEACIWNKSHARNDLTPTALAAIPEV
jgi:hypothetical protein